MRLPPPTTDELTIESWYEHVLSERREALIRKRLACIAKVGGACVALAALWVVLI